MQMNKTKKQKMRRAENVTTKTVKSPRGLKTFSTQLTRSITPFPLFYLFTDFPTKTCRKNGLIWWRHSSSSSSSSSYQQQQQQQQQVLYTCSGLYTSALTVDRTHPVHTLPCKQLTPPADITSACMLKQLQMIMSIESFSWTVLRLGKKWGWVRVFEYSNNEFRDWHITQAFGQTVRVPLIYGLWTPAISAVRADMSAVSTKPKTGFYPVTTTWSVVKKIEFHILIRNENLHQLHDIAT